MNSWRCTTETARGDDRERLWQEALSHISLPQARLRAHTDFHGEVVTLTLGSGIELSRVRSSPQTIYGACENRQPGLWMALPLRGTFLLGDEGSHTALNDGDIMYGPTGQDSTLTLTNDFSMLYVRIPRAVLHPRLLNLSALTTGTLSGLQASNRVFASLLRALGDELENLGEVHARPIEVAINEFVVANLGAESAAGQFDRASSSNFHRICQAIEAHLDDSELTPAQIAEKLHMSARYVQKLFQQAGSSFTRHVRQRRLERCRLDLASWNHRHLSICDICFRWGFNDAAHFSRSFRADFGTSPRAYRRQALAKYANAH